MDRTKIQCAYCKLNPGAKPNGVWKGFKDGDTNQLVCWSCQALHYRTKFKTDGMRGKYSELPVMTIAPQLMLNLKHF